MRSAAALKRFLAVSVVVLAYAYPGLLFVVVLLLRYVGEGYWVTTLALFLPRIGFGLPLPFIAVGLFVLKRRRLLLAQLASFLLVLFPLMGLVLPWPTGAKAGAPQLMVLSFNVDNSYAGSAQLVERIFAINPDIVVIQESVNGQDELVKLLGKRYPHVSASTQFVLASRYRILEETDPPKIPYYDRQRSPRFMRYVVEGPLGPLALYNVHPMSVRGVLQVHRGRAALHMLRSGELFAGDPASDVNHNAGLRKLQIEAVARLAARERHPVVLAGDFNLPTLSPTFARNLSSYADGFVRAGSGFGYSFPSKFRFLRLDRILASDALRFTSFNVSCEGLSDHRCVTAVLQRR